MQREPADPGVWSRSCPRCGVGMCTVRLAGRALILIAIVASVPAGTLTGVVPLLEQAAVQAGCAARSAPSYSEAPAATTRTTTTTITQRPNEPAEVIVRCELGGDNP